jgi:hypothetical protein
LIALMTNCNRILLAYLFLTVFHAYFSIEATHTFFCNKIPVSYRKSINSFNRKYMYQHMVI